MPEPAPAPRRPRRALLLGGAAIAVLALVGLALAGSARRGAGTGQSPSGLKGDERRLVLFYTAEIHGAVEPCGCTSDPLGDISRLAAQVKRARQSGAAVALVDAGGMLYPEGAVSPRERPSADLRGRFIATELKRLGLVGAALGLTDTTGGREHVQPPRLASNMTNAPAGLVQPAHVQKLGKIALGVAGVVEPAVAEAVGAGASDMEEAARHDVERLRKQGSDVVVLLAPVDRNAARGLARKSGADVVVMGKQVQKGLDRMEKVGRAFLVSPGDELQRVGRLEIVLRAPTGGAAATELVDAGGPDAIRARKEEIDRALERLREGLAKWQGADGKLRAGADQAFVEARRREVADLEAERQSLAAPWSPPASGSYLLNALVPLRRSLPRDQTVVAAMKKLDKSIAEQNLKHAEPPPKAEPGRATYVGMDKCTGCHKAATAFWDKTVHAHAWKTLVDGGKEADYKCVNCHVTGFGQIGGSSLGFTKGLESIQCETCHGPGSKHVEGEGDEQPLAIRRDTPETVCLECHTEQHSDTFQYVPYLRDIVGPGHGPKRRLSLGEGVTGHELRSAALAKAKVAGAEQANSM